MMTLFIFFLWFIITSIIMSFSASSLFFLWICLEINMMSFIPLMFSKNLISMNSIMMYFLVQSTASSIYIFSITTSFINYLSIPYMNIFMMMSMLIKLGAAPFHIWFPQVSEGLTLNSLLILLTIQKMIPLYILSIFKSNFILLPIIFSSIIGSFGGFNQFSIRKILAFSSISHLAWILTLQLSNSNFWMIYLMIYSMIIFFFIFIMNAYSMHFHNFSKKNTLKMNFFLIITLLSLGGMPPTIGFIMKWMTLQIIINSMLIITIPLILSSLINLFFYLRLSYTTLLKFSNLYKWEKSFSIKLIMVVIMQLLLIFTFISMM
uniref:NADH dehydrogenase subunit 2 n=1 Tax=Alectorobius guaporensis TaxID=1783522 RepID=UPI002237FDAD|nr:NADH dehydrogenase subunit 2 [Alectorobius guaporensis]UYB78340.1 NADH dehydrogenase subunit 2 [Alectorobius guaporensis]UYB78353.1 NADH dehydrogenase subunit 2 [Alectorobius guaporensis]